MAGVEHPHLMPMLSENGSQRLDAERRESHDLDPLITGLRTSKVFGQQAVEIHVVDPHEEYFHRQSSFRSLAVLPATEIEESWWGQETFGVSCEPQTKSV